MAITSAKRISRSEVFPVTQLYLKMTLVLPDSKLSNLKSAQGL